MSYLLAVSIGPVQEFISAARRTRDLHGGSKILSEVSKAVAVALRERNANLIFPSNPDKGAVANIILAETTENSPEALQILAERAKQAAQEKWLEYAGKIEQEFGPKIHLKRFRAQKSTVIETYAAWLPLEPGRYRVTRANLMRLLTGRKACRSFSQFEGEATVPKSSLDGARESVLVPGGLDDAGEGTALRLRLHKGEQLDAAGLIKRAALGYQQFTSIPRIAAGPWLRGLSSEDNDKLRAECRRLSIDEGDAVYRSRLPELVKEGVCKDVKALDALVQSLEKKYRIPNPYGAVLMADGDRMGAAISKIASAVDHRRFSGDLGRFASLAEKTVFEHFGCPVYAGGDDVLAFLPLDTAIECAGALRRDFKQAMSEWPDPPLTLSVGVAIGHNMENLEDLLKYARDTEKHAKNGERERPQSEERDALAVHLYPRGGQPVKIRRQWGTGIAGHLIELATVYQDGLFPDGAAYELREMARHYEIWPSEHIDLSAAILADTCRVLARKVAAPADKERIRGLAVARCQSGAELRAFAEEMIVARRLAEAYRQSGRRPGSPVL